MEEFKGETEIDKVNNVGLEIDEPIAAPWEENKEGEDAKE